MKIFAFLFFALLGRGAFAVPKHTSMNEVCEMEGGICKSMKEVKETCVQLPFQCSFSTVCCKETGLRSHFQNKKPRVASSKCKLLGGVCMHKKEEKYCKSRKVNSTLCLENRYICCLPEDCLCGQANEERIIGGKEVAPKNKYPWMVGLRNKVFSKNSYVCGGTLINDRYVISAAHCFFDDYKKLVRAKYIQLGFADHREMSTEDDVIGVTKIIDILKYIIHEYYDPSHLAHDIALIKLKKPLDLSAHKELKPVCLPVKKDNTYEGQNGIVLGWGENEMGLVNYALQEVTVPILDLECSGLVPRITEEMICAGTMEGGKDSCNGDSGGPLLVKEGISYKLVGIVSFSHAILCAQPSTPTIYVRITHYLDWIAKHTNDAHYCH